MKNRFRLSVAAAFIAIIFIAGCGTKKNPWNKYPAGFQAKEVAEQVKKLRYLFPELENASVNLELAKQPLPVGAEYYQAMPPWQKIAKTYGEAVEKVLAAIASERDFYNFRSSQMDQKYLAEHSQKIAGFKQLAAAQKTDILTIPAQFGMRYKGKSVLEARYLMAENEFGLGSYEVGIMLLTNPGRLQSFNNLFIDCPGDKFSVGGNGVFGHALCFCFCDGQVGLAADGVDSVDENYGSASAFLAQ